MKIKVIIISIALVSLGLIVFGFMNTREVNIHSTVDLQTEYVNQRASVNNQFGVELTKTNSQPLKSELAYTVRSGNGRTITKEILTTAESLGDIIPYYPANTITDYFSVEISTTVNNKEIKAVSPDQKLSTDQKKLFDSVDFASDILINVNYKTKNVVTNDVTPSQMKVNMTVVPETEATFVGGYDQLITYLKENSNEFTSTRNTDLSSVVFTINEEGEVEAVKLSATSGDTEIDNLLVDIITQMPKWNPARDSKGYPVKQQFEFIIGMDGC